LHNFKVHQFDDPWDEPDAAGMSYDYPSDCLDFIPLHAGTTTKYMSVARDSEPIKVNVWVAEPKRVGVVDDMAELTYENLAGAFAV
jgi:hypothetical protein